MGIIIRNLLAMNNCWFETNVINKYRVNLEHTPCHIFRPVVDLDVVDAEDAGQVYPPGGGPFVESRDWTLSS